MEINKIYGPLLTCVCFLSLANLYAQLPSAAEQIKERYEERAAAAAKNRDEGFARASTAHRREIDAAREEAKKAFEPLIRAAALRNQTEEMQTLTRQMEAITDPDAARAEHGTDGGDVMASDYKALVGGTWSTEPVIGSSINQRYKFEFKSNKKVIQEFQYGSDSGRNRSVYERRIDQKDNKIMIWETDDRESTRTKVWWQIAIPFSVEKLEVIRCIQSQTSNSSEKYTLKRDR